MRNLKKILATSFAIVALFTANGVFACSGEMIACTSWIDQMNEDANNNCGGDVDLNITWVDC